MASTKPLKNCGVFYVCKPDPVPVAAKIFEVRDMDTPEELTDGMFLTKTLGVCVAPHTRAFLELPGNDVGAEAAGLQRTKVGELIPCECAMEVIASKSKKYAVGDRCVSFTNLQRYSTFRDDGKDRPDGMAPPKLMKSVATEQGLSFTSGLTAHMVVNNHPCGRVEEPGLCNCFVGVLKTLFRRPQAQKTCLVTSAAGVVGMVAGQLYKLKGCKTIGVTSTREKADRLKEFGFDASIAYKEEDLDARLGEIAPEGIDVFFDNVGAKQLDIGTKHMKVGGKIVQVGCAAEIDNYATGKITGWHEYHRMAARELTVGGFLLSNHMSKIPMHAISLLLLQLRGKLKSEETLVHGGLDKFNECVDRLHSGQCFGRLILMLEDP